MLRVINNHYCLILPVKQTYMYFNKQFDKSKKPPPPWISRLGVSPVFFLLFWNCVYIRVWKIITFICILIESVLFEQEDLKTDYLAFKSFLPSDLSIKTGNQNILPQREFVVTVLIKNFTLWSSTSTVNTVNEKWLTGVI